MSTDDSPALGQYSADWTHGQIVVIVVLLGYVVLVFVLDGLLDMVGGLQLLHYNCNTQVIHKYLNVNNK